MNGAETLLRTLLANGVDVCFANPGTSEMRFVAALDRHRAMRGVLCLFEGVATGAADGYARMSGRPAATLLHLGPGLANGLANLHNARRAHTPVVNVIGDHARSHKELDSPLESDIDAAAATVSSWVRRPVTSADIGPDTAAAVAAALSADVPGPPDPSRTGTSGAVSTLIMAADLSWEESAPPAPRLPALPPRSVTRAEVEATAALVTGPERVALLIDGAGLSEPGLHAAARIRKATGTAAFCPTWPARLRRGAGVPQIVPLGYRAEAVGRQLAGIEHLILVGAREPVASFAYPGRPGMLTPPGTRVHRFVPDAGFDVVDALSALADTVAPGPVPTPPAPDAPPPLVNEPLSTENWAQVIGALLPQEAIVVDESITAGMNTLFPATADSAPHDVLGLTGLAIGQGIPVAAGAALACPERPVVCLQADGSALYTISGLWTQAREKLDVTTVILNNRSYAILRAELDRVGGSAAGPAARALFDLSRPDIDFTSLATGMGVPATRAASTAELAEQFSAALTAPGPHLIEAILQPA
ncbi:acetolactate synthase-1/2/3 large subunit [Actinacidiphila yanglinensis]|uniref:Acetolactate synthase-1/2/3 large subunit n=1 Tax=Actinacidiphila yanglinensis TaxID=310779 RepID=A0A1H6E7X4_9ACTN|nr:acetolactate synthase large subunit [Actinacidiphila yanglinensis]SEG93044.1 acetolactate synthase-1/2/3 large subunit [Actinacidiphila yanglinensis]